jgi:hypothetical protein
MLMECSHSASKMLSSKWIGLQGIRYGRGVAREITQVEPRTLTMHVSSSTGQAPGRGPEPRVQQDGMLTMVDVNALVPLVDKLAREALHASKTCGRRELDALEAAAQQYLMLYRDLKSRGVIE